MPGVDPWDLWLDGLADPARPFAVTVHGRLSDSRWGYPPRILHEHMLHFVTRGSHQGRVGGIAVRTQPQTLLWVPPGMEQDIRIDPAAGPLGFYYLRFTLDVPPPPRQPVTREGLGDCHPLFLRLHAEAAARLPGRERTLRAILVLIFSAWRRAVTASGDRLSDVQRQRVLTLVEDKPHRRIAPRWLALQLGMSHRVFASRFRRSFGMAPRQWLVQHRIHRAAQRLVEGGGSIDEVALEYGYPDHVLFSRQFSKIMGMGPSRWRDAPGQGSVG